MAKSKRGLWKRFGRFSSAAIVACFFLPFFGVSCSGMDMITASGADMVGGCQPGGLLMDAADQQKSKHHEDATMSGNIDMKIDHVDREPLAMIAMAAAVALLALSFLSTRGALVGCLLLALAGVGSLGGLYVKMTGKIHDEMADFQKQDQKLDKDADVSAGSRFGLWAVALGLIGTAVITGLALREKDDQSAPAGGST